MRKAGRQEYFDADHLVVHGYCGWGILPQAVSGDSSPLCEGDDSLPTHKKHTRAPRPQKIRTERKNPARSGKNTARTAKTTHGSQKARTERKKPRADCKKRARSAKSSARTIKSLHGAEKTRTERKKRPRRRIITDLARKCTTTAPPATPEPLHHRISSRSKTSASGERDIR